MMFENADWVCTDGHPASGMRYEMAEINDVPGDPNYIPGTWARVVVNGEVVLGPVRHVGIALREYNRRYIEFVEALEAED